MNRSRTRLTRLALIAAACAAAWAALPALAQQDHRHRDDGRGGGHNGEQHSPTPWSPGGGQHGGGPWSRVVPGPAPGYQSPYGGYTTPPRYYQAAPQPAYPPPGYRPSWRRGGFMPQNYPSSVVGEYWRFHLRRPPYGYEWVQAGSDFLLVSVATGMIFDVISGD